jgi:hypothetical protein
MRDDMERFDLRQRAGELVRHPVSEVLLIRARVVLEWQDRQRARLRSGGAPRAQPAENSNRAGHDHDGTREA